MNNSSRRSTRFFPLSFSAYFSPLFPSSSSIDRVRLSLSLPSSLSLGLIRENPLRECLLLRSRSEGRLMKFRDVRVSFNFVVGRWYDRGERSICLWEKKKRIEVVTIKVIIGSWCMGISFENEITIIRCNSLFFSFSSSDLLFFFFLDYLDSKVCTTIYFIFHTGSRSSKSVLKILFEKVRLIRKTNLLSLFHMIRPKLILPRNPL